MNLSMTFPLASPMTAGTAVTLYSIASSESWSMSTLAKSKPAFSAAASSLGPSSRHGPHQLKHYGDNSVQYTPSCINTHSTCPGLLCMEVNNHWLCGGEHFGSKFVFTSNLEHFSVGWAHPQLSNDHSSRSKYSRHSCMDFSVLFSAHQVHC